VKKKLLILVVLASVAVNSFAQTAFDYLRMSLINVLTLSTVAQIGNFDYDGSNALLGTYLEAGESLSMITSFDAGVQYLMLSAADLVDSDVDLKVYQGRGTGGTVIAKDIRSDSACVVRFTPASSGAYTFELINSSDVAVFISLITLRATRNPNFTLVSRAEALDITLGLSQQLAKDFPDAQIPSNKWALFGGDIPQGDSAGYYNSRLSEGFYMIVGAGERLVNNIDVEVIEQFAYDSTEGKGVSRNTNTNFPADYAIFVPDPSKNHYFKVINRSSRSSSAFIFGFMILAFED
jgi:hypothetical protein